MLEKSALHKYAMATTRMFVLSTTMSRFQLTRRRGTIRVNGGNNDDGNGDINTPDGSGSGGTAGSTTISTSDYARRCRELMNLDKDLRELGAGQFFSLPSITVIGGQSAGKSSLVEAVSGINVPRDSGTCTRCPMECSMSSSGDAWSCKISLRFDYDKHGARIESTSELFGPTITDKKSVELWLRRAQAAILSRHIPFQDFLTKSEQELRTAPPDVERLRFSKNSVLMAVNDPTITDLSFVDLPGLIQNEDPAVIEVVRDLAVTRIGKENTLILVTIPMSDDLQNQQAARLAREADPAGERTIVVLTKPDTLGQGATGSRQTWTAVLEGRKYQLTHGYYCVRLPDDDERSRVISRAESERRAADYFDSTQPWKDILDRSRFGVPNLTAFLSKLLVARIEANLPTLKEALKALLEKYRADLSGLPPPPINEASAEVLLRTANFCTAFRAAVFGDEHKGLSQKNRRLYLQFKAEIRSTSPDFRPFEGHSRYIDPNIVDNEPSDMLDVSGEIVHNNPPMDLLDVRQIIADSIGWELPNYVPFSATQTLVLRFTRKWREPSMLCFNAVVDASADLLDRLMTIHFGQFTQLEDCIRTLTLAELETCKDEALKTLEKMLALEKLPLYTQNTHYLQSESKVWLSRYVAVRKRPDTYLQSPLRVPNYGPASVHTVSPYSVAQPVPEVDQFSDELALMSKVRAYWQITYQRIIDYVPLLIEHEFCQNLASRLEGMLFQSLLKGPDVSAKMEELLTEDPIIAAKRSLVESRIARLLEIKQKLDGLS
ncbi:P-loop containing nucleoside triphosphate hydrolase protein [Mycena sp. CBHHK59/15]|nr:P-loop containing nucleoside triphosphate hydrolase protein [Mycena sp. CBHHK59/15]